MRLAALTTVAIVAATGSVARAEDSYVHVVRPGETLASIAQRYYGDPRRESVLVTENGLTAQGGSAIVVGLRLVVPWVHHHVVAEGETWASIAERYYGNEGRAFLLLEVNSGVPGEQPDVGQELVIPYPLRHVAGQNERLSRIALEHYRNDSTETIRSLRRFNGMRSVRPNRGQVVLVPLADLTLSDEGRSAIEEATGHAVGGGEVRELQQRIEQRLPSLLEHIRRGRYTEAVSLANRLLGAGRLTGNQIVTIQRELGTAYVALDRPDLAVEAFEHALRRQADLELDVARTSPTVLRAFNEARERWRATQAREAREARDAGTPDAGTQTPTPAPTRMRR